MKTTETISLSPIGVIMLGWLLMHPDGGTAAQIEHGMRTLIKLWRSNSADRRQGISAEAPSFEKAGWIKRVRRSSFQITPSGKGEILNALQRPSLSRNTTTRMIKNQIILVVIALWMNAALNVPQAAPPEKKRQPLPQDDATFAQRVLAAARASKTGRFGDNKVFISHVMRQLEADGLAISDVKAFKDRLVTAHRGKLLALSRADLVQAMEPADVEESETLYLNGSFHFVRI
jgi:hypothetical protein